MPPETLTPDHTYLRLRQDEYFQPFFRHYLELLKPHLKRLQVMDSNGHFHHSHLTCGQDHDKRNQEWSNPNIKDLTQALQAGIGGGGCDFFLEQHAE